MADQFETLPVRPLSLIRWWHIALFALVLRLIWALLVPIVPVSDPSAYDELAQQLARGNGYRWNSGQLTAYWPVGTPAIYAAVYASIGRNLLVVGLLNAVLGALLVGATYALAQSTFSRSVALIAGFLVAIWPTWIAFTSIISSELPTTLLFTAGTALAFCKRFPPATRTIGAAALITLAAYCRANLLPFALLIPALALVFERPARSILPRSVLAILVIAVLIAPWAMRNKAALGSAVPISTNLGVNLWIGNNPIADGGFSPPPPLPARSLPADEVAQDLAYRTAATDYILHNPQRYVALCAKRVILSLDRETFGVSWNSGGLPSGATAPLKLVMTGYWWVILLLSMIGAITLLRRDVHNFYSPFILLPVALMAAPILVMATERYHYALTPFMSALAAFVLARLLRSGRGQRQSLELDKSGEI